MTKISLGDKVYLETSPDKISLDSESLLSVLSSVLDRSKYNDTLRTGFRGLNQLLSGGYRRNKVYCYMTDSTDMLINMLLENLVTMKEYNVDVSHVPTESHKKILFVSTRTTVDSLMHRIIDTRVGLENIAHKKMDMADVLVRAGLKLRNSDYNISIQYVPQGKLTTQLLENMVAKDSNIAALIIDDVHNLYVRETGTNLRIASKTLKSLASENNIPVIMGSVVSESILENGLIQNIQNGFGAELEDIKESVDFVATVKYNQPTKWASDVTKKTGINIDGIYDRSGNNYGPIMIGFENDRGKLIEDINTVSGGEYSE